MAGRIPRLLSLPLLRVFPDVPKKSVILAAGEPMT
jgi:hypothetical protein